MKLEQSKEIETALKSFAAGNLTENALGLFETLGYNTARRANFDRPSFLYFKENYFSDDTAFNEKNALVADWQAVDLLFQLSADEMSDQTAMFNAAAVDRARIESYLFFAVELKQSEYSRTALSQITRELNRVFPMPAFVLFKYGGLLTLAVINRRLHKRDEARDVLEKVTLIKDVRISNPHHAHTEILFELSFAELAAQQRVTNFVELHNAWQKTLDVEIVTNRFFSDYKTVFERVEVEVAKQISDGETARLFAQRLFNRLMFIYFLQKKGWLKFENATNYLRAVFQKAESANENFYRDRLYWIFFYGLSNVGESVETHDDERLRERRGQVPYLNGGLFEMDHDGFDERGKIELSNGLFGEIFRLFEKYNFTVEESTPYEIQVAIDPEILGRVFEELVTGRHESGSYYTPRQIVSFMCRESLKHYLAEFDSDETIAEFVDDGTGENLTNPEQVLNALKQIRVCDPACGSGAYLLGMMQELLRLRDALFTSKHLGDASLYNRKREIIENNIYGVDKDRFAVQIASLRLWLSLAIESKEPRALPNLKYKIGCGDSLLAPLDTDLQPNLQRRALIEQFRALKADYAKAFDYEQKRRIDDEITDLRVQLARLFQHLPESPKPERIKLAESQIQPLADKIRRLITSGDKHQAEKFQKELNKLAADIESQQRQIAVKEYKPDFFDWQIEFAEVFADGGFDVVLANPPYIRQELLGRDYKENGLKPNFTEVYSGTADIYIYFFARANRMLKTGGVGCFISSNKWLRAGYGEKLRQTLLDATKFHLVVDFGELPVFKAATFPAIFLWQNATRQETPTNWAVVKDLQICYAEGVREHILRLRETLPPSQFGIGKSRLASIHTTSLRETMEQSGVRLKEYVNGEIYYGIKTGLNEAFIINRETRDNLIAEDERSAEIIKPILAGDDVRKYETHFREDYLIWTYVGVEIEKYPAIFRHLKQFQEKAEKRCDKGNHWWELRHCAYYEAFENPKIIYPEIAKQSRFTTDDAKMFTNKTAFIIPISDYFLLSVLNSLTVWQYLKVVCAVLGDEEAAGRLTLQGIYLETLPIPNASDDERGAVADLARATQNLHTRRRLIVEQFLLAVGTSAARSTSRNLLEQPWTIDETEFLRRTHSRFDAVIFRRAQDETRALTDQITNIEREIDQRVAALYNVAV